MKNNKPGLWWTFRCGDCGQMKLTLNGALYRGVIGALNEARARGWECEDVSSIAIDLHCPGCIAARRGAAIAAQAS